MRIALGIEYDGSAFCGWQIQPDMPSVQAMLEGAVGRFLAAPASVICAGRTDTGVHATHQVVSLDTEVVRPERNWVRGVNTHLPPTVAVLWARAVPDEFHARFDATARTYEYWLYNHAVRSPVYEKRAGWVWRPLDVDLMRRGAECLLGTHDFSSFRAAECQANDPRAHDRVARNRPQGPSRGPSHHRERLPTSHGAKHRGNARLRRHGARAPRMGEGSVEARSRAVAAPTFSPDGLYLTGVRYPGVDIPQSGMSPFGFDD